VQDVSDNFRPVSAGDSAVRIQCGIRLNADLCPQVAEFVGHHCVPSQYVQLQYVRLCARIDSWDIEMRLARGNAREMSIQVGGAHQAPVRSNRQFESGLRSLEETFWFVAFPILIARPSLHVRAP
jgi:hypothetical protein